MKKILLIDGHSFLFRAFFASMKMSDWKETSSAIFIAIKMLHSFLAQNKNYYQILFFFDVGKSSFRFKILDQYKANRKPTPQSLRQQIPILKNFLKIAGFQIFENSKYEADDLIASATQIANKKNFFVDVLSSDRDLLQIVSPKTNLLIPQRGWHDLRKITFQNIFSEFGLKANQIVDFKSLAGDNSDNIPGVRKVGKITAQKLLTKYGSIDQIYENLRDLPSALQKNLSNEKKTVAKFQKIIQLADSVDLKIDFSPTKMNLKSSACMLFYEKHKFHSLLKTKSFSSSVVKKRSFF